MSAKNRTGSRYSVALLPETTEAKSASEIRPWRTSDLGRQVSKIVAMVIVSLPLLAVVRGMLSAFYAPSVLSFTAEDVPRAGRRAARVLELSARHRTDLRSSSLSTPAKGLELRSGWPSSGPSSGISRIDRDFNQGWVGVAHRTAHTRSVMFT